MLHLLVEDSSVLTLDAIELSGRPLFGSSTTPPSFAVTITTGAQYSSRNQEGTKYLSNAWQWKDHGVKTELPLDAFMPVRRAGGPTPASDVWTQVSKTLKTRSKGQDRSFQLLILVVSFILVYHPPELNLLIEERRFADRSSLWQVIFWRGRESVSLLG